MSDNEKNSNSLPWGCAILVVGFIVAFVAIGSLMNWLTTSFKDTVECGVYSESTIHGLSLNSATEGGFILGIGSFDEHEYYVFYRKTSSGAFLREHIRVEDCLIREGHATPTISRPGYNEYSVSWGDTVSTEFHISGRYGRCGHYYQYLNVPTGTITQQVGKIEL